MTPEQQGLLEKAARSLQAARVLNEKGLAEFATSRAYYTMFTSRQHFWKVRDFLFLGIPLSLLPLVNNLPVQSAFP